MPDDLVFPPFGALGERLLPPGTSYNIWSNGYTATVSKDGKVLMRCRLGDAVWGEG